MMGRPCGRALPPFNVVVLHDVRCRKLPLVPSRGPRAIKKKEKMFGRRIGPGGWYLTHPVINGTFLLCFFLLQGVVCWAVLCWYLREGSRVVSSLSSNTVNLYNITIIIFSGSLPPSPISPHPQHLLYQPNSIHYAPSTKR